MPEKTKVSVPRIKRIVAQRPSQVVNKKRVIYEFDGRFLDSFGTPERNAKWFITGPSFSGKSSLMYMLCDYLCRFGIVDYNSHEEGDSMTVADKIVKHGLMEHESAFRLLSKMPLTEFKERFTKKRSANFGVIDSLQHCQVTTSEYKDYVNALCTTRRGKSMLFISHWVNNDFTKFVRHDCDIKIIVIGFVARVESRFGGGKPFIIWEEGAKRYWGKKYKQISEGVYWPGLKK